MNPGDQRMKQDETLEMRLPPAALAPFVSAFVHRDESGVGGVVRVLPELRASIQIMIADPSWQRERQAPAEWAELPRVALWAPRFEWAYCFARHHIKAYAVGLTPAGFAAIARRPASALINRVLALADFDADLAGVMAPLEDEAFDAWRQRTAAALAAFFSNAPSPAYDLEPAMRVLATAESGAVEQAAALTGVSQRQFRRLFEEIYGVSPKRYQRALRVDRMIRQLHPMPWERDPHEDEGIAFSDQPHAIREFRAMTGLTPGEYVKLKTGGDRTLRSIPADEVAPPAQ
jgi:AraC-like DNA-binding protein